MKHLSIQLDERVTKRLLKRYIRLKDAYKLKKFQKFLKDQYDDLGPEARPAAWPPG